MCNVLSDIEVAQGLKEQQAEEHEQAKVQSHPADEKYDSLQADLELLSSEDPQHDLIARFVKVCVHPLYLVCTITGVQPACALVVHPGLMVHVFALV